MSDSIYSYHTFVLPFTWEMNKVESKQEYKGLKKVFDSNPFWMRTDLEDFSNYKGISSKPDVKTFDDIKGFYKEYQYFYPHVRKALYGGKDDICTNYLFEPSWKNGEYHIIKGEKHYMLNINAIRVKVYNTGVALFIMECENRGKDGNGNDQTSISAVKDINDYGRRITLPFIDTQSSVCADRLELSIPGIGRFSDDFKSFCEDVYKAGEKAVDISLTHMCDFIKQLMSYGGNYEFVSRNPKDETEIQVFPALDDRMYVTYAVSVEKDVDMFVEETHGEPAYQVDDDLSKSIYELAYMDHDNSCSCPDRKMRNDLNNKALYQRWFPYGTIYTISEMGFGMLSTAKRLNEKGELFHLYESFLTCYQQMVYLAIVQKASVVNFNRETANIAGKFAAYGKKLGGDDIRKIMNLQERHAAFDSQLRFSEVSSEQQAIEMYDKLKDVFSLKEENEKLDSDLSRLYEIANNNLSISGNTGVTILTWASIVLAIAALMYNILFASDVVIRCNDNRLSGKEFVTIDISHWIFLVIMLGVVVVLGLFTKLINRRK